MQMTASRVEHGAFASALLSRGQGWRIDLRRVATGLALAAIYGLAIGARYGVASMAVHAAGAPLALLAVAAFAAPAFYIGIAHANLPVSLETLRGAVARGVATVGLVLAGLAPGALLVTVTTEGGLSAAVIGGLGLLAAGTLGLRHTMRELLLRVSDADPAKRRRAKLLSTVFALFVVVLAARVWWLVLPMLGRAHFLGGAA
jgi:hypothetical protein